jgi:hypothetical protein
MDRPAPDERLNRPRAPPTFRPLAAPQRHDVDRLVLLALIGSGLYLAELLRLNVGDVGSLDAHGGLVPDPQAEPLAVQYAPRRGRAGTRLTFLTPQARAALEADLTRRAGAGIARWTAWRRRCATAHRAAPLRMWPTVAARAGRPPRA